MKEIQLRLSTEEVNQIMEALGDQPFKSVFNLIGKVQQQAQQQLSNNGEAPEADVKKAGKAEKAVASGK